MKPTASIIIRSFNEEKYIGKCLRYISNQKTSGTFEVILVDSGSTDNTVRIAETCGACVVRINPEDFSFGCSLNKGIERARGEFCVMISAHCYPENENWLEQLLKPFSDVKVALVYGRQRGNDITKYSEHQVFATWFPDTPNARQEVPFCNNANSAIRKSLWLRKKFDEQLSGMEDIDWAKFALANSYYLSYAPESSVIHVHDESYKQVYIRYFREARAIKSIFPESSFSLLDFVRLLGRNILTDFVHAIGDRQFLNNLMDVPIFRCLQFWAAYRGHRRLEIMDAHLKARLYYPRDFKLSNITRTRRHRAQARQDYQTLETYENS